MKTLFALLNIILILAITGQPVFSQPSEISQLRIEIESADSDSQRIDLKNQLARQLNLAGDNWEARKEVQEVLRSSNMIGYQKGYLNGLLNLADHYLLREIPDSAMAPIREGLARVEDPVLKMDFLSMRGTAYRMDGKPAEAIREYNRAIEIADSLEIQDKKAKVLFNMSSAQKMIGEMSDAFENLYNSLVYAEAAGESQFLAVIQNNMGQMYSDLESPEEALYHLKEAETLSRQLGLKSNLVRTLINQGNVYSNLGRFEDAESAYRQASELSEQMGDYLRPVSLTYNLGQLHFKRGNFAEARELLMESFTKSNDMDIVEGMYYSSLGLGDVSRTEQKYSEAVDWYQQAVETSRMMQAKPLQTAAMEHLYDIYKELENHTAALNILEELKAQSDSLRTMERERARAEYETRMEVRRQENQNRLLMARQSEQEAKLQVQRLFIVSGLLGFLVLAVVAGLLYRNVQLRKKINEHLKTRHQDVSRKNEELDHLNMVKNKMFAVVAHDLRGPIGSLQSLLYLMREHELSKEEVDEIVESLEESLNQNASTMENLLAWAKSQMNGIKLNERVFDLISAIKTVSAQVKFQAEQKNIMIHTDIDPTIEVKADYDTLKLVIRNLITNAIKFCGDGDSIRIEANVRDQDFVEVSIADTGIGIKPEDQKKIFGEEQFTKKGTRNEKGSGLGLVLCKEFIEKHGGEIWFESEYEVGTTFYLTIPLATVAKKKIKKKPKPSADLI